MPRAAHRRESVDVVVPFAGSQSALAELIARMQELDLGPADTLTVVDNRPAHAAPVEGAVRAPERPSSYFARNRGAANGSNPWLVFLDADVLPPSDLIDRYFEEQPRGEVGVLAGSVLDEPLDRAERPSIAARYAMLAASMSQEITLQRGPWSYAKTANCAVRRTAFEAVGGFRSDIRSGGDADLCFRVRAAGWTIEPRDGAAVVHRSRTTLRSLLRQRARHGSGAAWLDRRYPGAFPPGRWLGLAKWTVMSFGRSAIDGTRGRRDAAVVAFVEPLVAWAFELGRRFPNEVPDR